MNKAGSNGRITAHYPTLIRSAVVDHRGVRFVHTRGKASEIFALCRSQAVNMVQRSEAEAAVQDDEILSKSEAG